MSRIVTVTNQEVRREAVAPRTEINWDPRTGNGFIRYSVEDEVTVDGVYQGLDNQRTFKVSLADILGRTFTVQTGPESSIDIPAMLVMGALKIAFEEFYEEHLEAEALRNNPPAPEPTEPELTEPTPE